MLYAGIPQVRVADVMEQLVGVFTHGQGVGRSSGLVELAARPLNTGTP